MKKDQEKMELKIWNNLPDANTHSENLRLIKEYKLYGDTKIRDKIVYSNMKLINYLIHKYYENIVNCDGPIYPSLEDLKQEAVLTCIKAIERFNPEYNFTFATYLTRLIRNDMLMIRRKAMSKGNNKSVRLSSTANGRKNGRNSDDDGAELEDMIEDLSVSPEAINAKVELAFIENNVLYYLSKRDKQIFYETYYNKLSQHQIAEKLDISRSYVSRLLSEVYTRVIEIYENGPSEEDEHYRGISLGSKKETYDKSRAILKKYTKGFLVNCFIPTLSDREQKVFDRFLFANYAQNSLVEIAKGLKISYNDYNICIANILQKLEDEGASLLETYKAETPPRKKAKKVIQEVNRTKRLIEQKGGKLFLEKYFAPTLNSREKKIFEQRFLHYEGESIVEISKRTNTPVKNFHMLYNSVLEKLQNADFEVLVDLVDNAEKYKAGVEKIFIDKTQLVKDRMELVKKYGGVLKLQEYFLPILADNQKKVFDCMYLRPRYDSLSSMSNDLKIPQPALYVAEKTMLEKLKVTDFDELNRIKKYAELELVLDTNEMKSKGEWYVKKAQERKLKYGGEQYLKEVFMPTLEVKAHKIIFQRSLLEGVSDRQVLDELNLPKKGYDYLKRTKALLLQQLRTFKISNPNFDKDVQDFYARNEFERLHPENFEELAFKVEKEVKTEENPKLTPLDINNVGRESDKVRRKEFMNEYLSNFGDKKDIIRNFLPTLKKIVQQQVFLGFFLECKLDEENRKELGLSAVDLRSVKNSIIGHLESYAKEKKQKQKQKNHTK